VDRDSTAVFLDWDDTLFPSSFIKAEQRRCQAAGQPMSLQTNPKMKVLCSEIVSFLSTASRVGHVFIVTAASHDFIRKSCGVCFPELLKVIDALQVTIIYARPIGDAEHYEPIETWKEAAFRRALEAPHTRPLPPALARFHDSVGWQNIISYGDQWTDHTALLKAAAAFAPNSSIKTVKALCPEEGLRPGELAQELRHFSRMLPTLAVLEAGCSYDLDDPEIRSAAEFPPRSVESPSSGSPSSSVYSVKPFLTPKSSSSASTMATPLGLDPLSSLNVSRRSFSKTSVHSDFDAQTDPGYMENLDITPAHGKRNRVLCEEAV
jgi:hypothetical protein